MPRLVSTKHPSGRARLMLLLLALVLASSSSAALALDYCMTYSGGGSWVFKRLKVPAKDRCTAVNGFEVPVGNHGMLSGTACTEGQSGGSMTLHYTSHGGSNSAFETAWCQLRLDQASAGTTPGVCVGQYFKYPGDWGRFSQQVTLRRCDVKVPY